MFKKFIQRDPVMSFGIIIVIITLLISSAVLMPAIADINFRKTALEANAVITDIAGYGDNQTVYLYYETQDGKPEKRVPLSFSLDGAAVIRAGDVISIYYDPENPRNIRQRENV